MRFESNPSRECSGMSEQVLTKDFELSGFEYYNPGEIVFKEGTKGHVIYLVLKGQVEIFNMVEGKKVIVDKLTEGTLFGEVAFMDRNPRSASARAVTNVTLGVVDRGTLIAEYQKLPHNLQIIFDAMARRLRRLTMVSSNLAGRRHDRADQGLKVRFKTREDFFKAYSANIGGGGIFVATDENVPEGTVVEVEFNLPGETKTISATGRVAWRSIPPDAGLGIEFTALNPDDKIRLGAYVRKAIEE